MKTKEVYIHTRNYGCRIREYICHDIRMVSVENECIKAVFALDKGADIVELVYKPADLDYMWHSFNELKRIRHPSTVASAAGNFMDSYSGGWQDLFPTYGRTVTYCGAQIGQHGESCMYPWDCVILEDTPECVRLKLSVRLVRTPFALEKTVTLRENSGCLNIRESITNTGSQDLPYMWGQHPAFGWPFVDKGTKLVIRGTPKIRLSKSTAQKCPFQPGAEGIWPYMTGENGEQVDMSVAFGPEDRLYMEYGLSQLDEGSYDLINENLGLGIRVQWDLAQFPYLWIWGMYRGAEEYPWFGRAYTMAVEPWSSMPANFELAQEAGTTKQIRAGETIETEITAQLFRCE